jgi:transketolase
VTIEECEGPVCLLLTRQGLPVLDRTVLAGADGLGRGAYILSEADKDAPQAIVVATGSEVSVALEAQEALRGEGIAVRVVSMPSWELFDAQPPDYTGSIFPTGVPVVSVEAGVSQGWERFADAMVSIERFGASAPGPEVMAKLGITPDAVVGRVQELLADTPPAS